MSRPFVRSTIYAPPFTLAGVFTMPIPPSIIPSKRRVRRKRRASAAPSGTFPSGTITVLSVLAQTDHIVVWTFSEDASTDGSAIQQLLVQTTVGLLAPAESWQGAAANQIACNYDNGEVAPGAAWQVTAQPEGITFPGGGTLVVPQSGVLG